MGSRSQEDIAREEIGIQTENVLNDVFTERERQVRLHGDHTPADPGMDPCMKLAILMEEVGEVARELCDGPTRNLRVELIQVAAVAVAWAESL